MAPFTAPSAGTIRRIGPTNPITAIFQSIVGVFVGIIFVLFLATAILWYAESQNSAKVFSHSKQVDPTSGASGYIRTMGVASADSPALCYQSKVDGNCLYYSYKLEQLQYEVKDYCGQLSSNQQVIAQKGQECDSNNNCKQCYTVNESNWNVVSSQRKVLPFSIGSFKVSYPDNARIVGASLYSKQIDTTHRESMDYIKDASNVLVAGSSDGQIISDGGSKKFLVLSTKDYQGTYDTFKTNDRVIAWVLRLLTFFVLFLGYSMIFGPISLMVGFVGRIPIIGRFIGGAGKAIIAFVSLVLALVHFIILWILIMIIKNIVVIIIVIALVLAGFWFYSKYKKTPSKK
ncbi:TMEM43 family protein [Candidatus Pacearchaeota archaeon]|nr:TMEM43 family protein [Candidatus Pacearchaeota archaeon]